MTDQHQQVALAAREAIRVLPRTSSLGGDLGEIVLLSCLRAILAAGVFAANAPSHASKRSANGAARAAYLAANNAYEFDEAAASAAETAANAAEAAAHSKHYTTYENKGSAAKDVAAFKSGNGVRDVFSQALWSEGEPSASLANHFSRLERIWAKKDCWDFWGRWYQGFLEGQPIDWDVQEEIARIPDAEWHKGPEWVAELIAEIEPEFLSEARPLAELIEFDTEKSVFRRSPISVEKSDLIGATLSTLEDAWGDVLARPSNGLSQVSREARLIDRTLRKYSNDPQRIEMNLTDLHRSLLRQITATGDLPASEENLALQKAAEQGSLAIRATHPDVAANRTVLSGATWRALPEADRAFVRDSLLVLQALSDDDLADEWADDIPKLLNDAAGPPAMNAPSISADAATRVFNRAAKMSILARTREVIEKLYDHPARKLGAVIAVGTTILGFLVYLVRIGVGLL